MSEAECQCPEPEATNGRRDQRRRKNERRIWVAAGCRLLGLVRWVVPSKYRKNLGIGFLILKLVTMARRERGSREASALGVVG